MAVEAELARLRAACVQISAEVCETLGDAIYGPTPPSAPGPVWAIHVPETIAEEAARVITVLRGALQRAWAREAAARALLEGMTPASSASCRCGQLDSARVNAHDICTWLADPGPDAHDPWLRFAAGLTS